MSWFYAPLLPAAGQLSPPAGTLLLDVVPNAVYAYGLRKLRTAYTGYAIKIRRSNDNAEQDIGFSGDDLDLAAITSFVGSNSAYVKTWYDQSGNGRDATQATSGNQPRLVNAGTLETQNGKPSIYFDGSNDYLRNTGFAGLISSAMTIAFVGTVSSGNSNVYARWLAAYKDSDVTDYNETTSLQLINLNNGNTNVQFFQAPQYNSFPTNTLAIAVGTCTTGTDNSKYYINSGLRATATRSLAISTAQNLLIATNGDNGSFGGYTIQGHCSEIVIYATALASGDRLSVEGNERDYFTPPVNFQDYWDEVLLDEIPGDAIFSTFQVTGDSSPGFHSSDHNILTDVNYQVTSWDADPVVNIYEDGSWTDRDSGSTLLGTFHIPYSFVVPDVTPPDTPNNPCIVVNASSSTALYGNAIARPSAGGSFWAYIAGLKNSTHGGSYIAGGELTAAELASTINHALVINVWGQRYLSRLDGGFVAPAVVADTGYDDSGSGNYYNGSDARIKMGSWVGIPSSVTAGDLGIVSTEGQALLLALQTYGAYICDNSAWNALYINATADTVATLTAIKTEVEALFGAMQLVSVLHTVSSSDSLSLSVSESKLLKALLSRTDSVSLSFTENRTILGILNRADSLGLSFSDVSHILAVLSRTDSLTLSATDSSAMKNLLASTDSLNVSVSSTVALMLALQSSDSISVAIAEGTPSILAILNRADTLGVGINEVIALVVMLSRTDALGLNVSESADLVIALQAADTIGLSLSEARQILALLTRTDSLGLSVGESIILLGLLVGADSLALSFSEQSRLNINLTSADSLNLAVSSIMTIAGVLQRTDTLSVSASEVRNLLVKLSSSDTLSFSLQEAFALLVGVSAADSLATGLSESSAINSLGIIIQVMSSDQLGLSLTEATPDLLVLLHRMDQIAPGILDRLKLLDYFPKLLARVHLTEQLGILAKISETLAARAALSESLLPP